MSNNVQKLYLQKLVALLYVAKILNDLTNNFDYYVQGSQILAEKRSDLSMPIWYYYDESGVYGMNYQGTKYLFEKNILGDVVGIYKYDSGFVGTYTYDAWGNITSQTNNAVTNANPFR